MKKVLFLLMAAVVMSMSFAACSYKKGSKDDKENGEDKEKTEKVEAEDEDEESEETEVAEVADFSEVSGTPAEQYVALTKQFIAIIKSTHINSLADAEAFKTIGEKYKVKMVALQKEIENLSSEDQMKVAGEMMSLVGELKDLEQEAKRLEQEAAAVGVNFDDLGLD